MPNLSKPLNTLAILDIDPSRIKISKKISDDIENQGKKLKLEQLLKKKNIRSNVDNALRS